MHVLTPPYDTALYIASEKVDQNGNTENTVLQYIIHLFDMI